MATFSLFLTVAIFASGCAAQPVLQLAIPSSGPRIDAVVLAARADAAKRSGLALAQLQVLEAGSVTWPDSSLGCPRPGMLYTEALVAGYRVKLRVGGEVWDYHAAERGGLILCPPEQSQEPAPDSRI